MTKSPTKTMFLKIGGKLYQVASYEQASVMYCKARDASNRGASQISAKQIVDENGAAIAYVSYNGRVWPGSPKNRNPDALPLYDNRT